MCDFNEECEQGDGFCSQYIGPFYEKPDCLKLPVSQKPRRTEGPTREALGSLTIWMEEPTPFKEALEKMTDDWVDDDQCSAQTVFDLRDICKALLANK